MIKKLAFTGLAACAMIFATGASSSWINQVTETDGGHRIGKSDAKVTVTEFVSYTCPACANFTKDGGGALEIGYVATGKVNLEIRHIIRGPVDLTAVMLTHCGAPEKFPKNHTAFMLKQDQWLAVMDKTTTAQRNRWVSGDYAARRRAIASDLGFYKIMEQRGYRRTDADKCLADDAKATSLAEQSDENRDKHFVTATPSFAVNGITLAGTHSWSVLEPQIKLRLP
jgi:hypothetical protein